MVTTSRGGLTTIEPSATWSPSWLRQVIAIVARLRSGSSAATSTRTAIVSPMKTGRWYSM